MLQVNFSIKESEISRFQKYRNLIGKSKKNVLTGAHKTFEGCRQLHTHMYLPAPKAQDEFKMKLPFDMVSFHLFFILYLPDYVYDTTRIQELLQKQLCPLTKTYTGKFMDFIETSLLLRFSCKSNTS